MNTHIGMKNGTEMDLMNKYNEITDDLFRNEKDLFNRREYYTRKYRGNRLDDVNVGIWEEGNNTFCLQIFLRNRKNQYVKQLLMYNMRGEMLVKGSESNMEIFNKQ